MTAAELRRRWRNRAEVALFDAREEFAFAESHPFFAVSLPPSRVETHAYSLAPRLSVPVVVYGAGAGDLAASFVAEHLRAMGYTEVSFLEGGLDAWANAGGELFRDVNVPSKAFGELVESVRHTPSLSADEVHALIERGANIAVLDVRRTSEYRTMSIPGATSVPGAELALRARSLAPDPETLVIVNCAGRTRSIIGTQSLLNSGLPNRVAALRNGTIGWTLAGLELDRSASRIFDLLPPPDSVREAAEAGARHVAQGSGVREIDSARLDRLRNERDTRTLYCLDVRTEDEYRAGHPAGFAHAPGGQLVQATDEWIAVRGARIALYSDDAVRALMTASWLAQMGWEVHVVRDLPTEETGMPTRPLPPLPACRSITPQELLAESEAVVLDLAPSPLYRAGHLPGAQFVIRSQMATVGPTLPPGLLVLTSPDGALARYAAPELGAVTGRSVAVLDGGTAAFAAAGNRLETGGKNLPQDVYKRPYEGTDSTRETMQAYIDWELKLVDQIKRDGIANFQVWQGV